MMRMSAVAALFGDLDAAELTIWVERGWVCPERTDTEWVFQEIDIARVRLIHDLRREMAIQDEALPVILSLLDQVHDLRARLQSLLRAVECQPDAVRRAIHRAL